MRERKKSKKKKKKHKGSRSSSSSSSRSSSSEDEELKADIKTLKSFVKKLQKKIKLLDQGIKQWYRTFDADGSDQIELDEFLRMLEYLRISTEENRVVTMLFALFDRNDHTYFTFVEFEDIIEERMMPNYKKVV